MWMWTGLPAASRWLRRRHRERAGRPDGGFTLLEVLVAFTILALMMTVLLRIFSDGFRGMSAAERYAVSALHAQSALAAVGAEIPLQVGAWSGDFDDGFRWSVHIDAYTEPGLLTEPPTFTAYRIAVVVDNGDAKGRVALASLRISQPESPVPEETDAGAAPQ